VAEKLDASNPRMIFHSEYQFEGWLVWRLRLSIWSECRSGGRGTRIGHNEKPLTWVRGQIRGPPPSTPPEVCLSGAATARRGHIAQGAPTGSGKLYCPRPHERRTTKTPDPAKTPDQGRQTVTGLWEDIKAWSKIRTMRFFCRLFHVLGTSKLRQSSADALMKC